MTNQFAEISSISHLDPLARIRICRKLDIKHPVCGDYRELAAHFDMPNTDIIVISQNPDPTDNVLHTIQRNPKNTIAKLRQVLVIMGRDDCVMIIDESLLGMYSYYIVLHIIFLHGTHVWGRFFSHRISTEVV